MHKSLRIISLILFLLIMTVNAGCMGSPPDTTVVKFLKKCQSGDWSGAESMLSETGRLHFEQRKSLEDTYWPMLGLAGKAGIPFDLIKAKFDTAVIVIAEDSSATRGTVRMKINNSELIGKDAAKSIATSVGLESIDVIIKFKLVQEMNRWKIEMIAPQQLTDQEKVCWENLAKKSPTSLGI